MHSANIIKAFFFHIHVLTFEKQELAFLKRKIAINPKRIIIESFVAYNLVWGHPVGEMHI